MKIPNSALILKKDGIKVGEVKPFVLNSEEFYSYCLITKELEKQGYTLGVEVSVDESNK